MNKAENYIVASHIGLAAFPIIRRCSVSSNAYRIAKPMFLVMDLIHNVLIGQRI